MCLEFQIEEVVNRLSKQKSLELLARLYQNEQNWVRSLDSEIVTIFDSKRIRFSGVVVAAIGY